MAKPHPSWFNFYDTIHTCIEYWHVNNKYQAAFRSIARSRQAPYQEPCCQPGDDPSGSRPPGARSVGVTVPAGGRTASRPPQVLSPALICRSRGGGPALQNARKIDWSGRESFVLSSLRPFSDLPLIRKRREGGGHAPRQGQPADDQPAHCSGGLQCQCSLQTPRLAFSKYIDIL